MQILCEVIYLYLNTYSTISMNDQIEICKTDILHLDAIERAKNSLPESSQIIDMSEIFKILGDPSRLKILLALAQEELCVCDIATLIRSSVSSVSHHLRLLKGLKLVKFRKEGKLVFYALADHHVESIVAQAMDHVTE